MLSALSKGWGSDSGRNRPHSSPGHCSTPPPATAPRSTQTNQTAWSHPHPNRAPTEIATAARLLIEIGPGTILGHLEQTPGYPTVRVGPNLTANIQGTIFQLPEDPTLLPRLDAYEHFYPNSPTTSLFLRQQVQATRPTGDQLTCWAYIYNGPI